MTDEMIIRTCEFRDEMFLSLNIFESEKDQRNVKKLPTINFRVKKEIQNSDGMAFMLNNVTA